MSKGWSGCGWRENGIVQRLVIKQKRNIDVSSVLRRNFHVQVEN